MSYTQKDKARAADFLSRNLPTSKNDQVITVKKDEVPKGTFTIKTEKELSSTFASCPELLQNLKKQLKFASGTTFKVTIKGTSQGTSIEVREEREVVKPAATTTTTAPQKNFGSPTSSTNNRLSMAVTPTHKAEEKKPTATTTHSAPPSFNKPSNTSTTASAKPTVTSSITFGGSSNNRATTSFTKTPVTNSTTAPKTTTVTAPGTFKKPELHSTLRSPSPPTSVGKTASNPLLHKSPQASSAPTFSHRPSTAVTTAAATPRPITQSANTTTNNGMSSNLKALNLNTMSAKTPVTQHTTVGSPGRVTTMSATKNSKEHVITKPSINTTTVNGSRDDSSAGGHKPKPLPKTPTSESPEVPRKEEEKHEKSPFAAIGNVFKKLVNGGKDKSEDSSPNNSQGRAYSSTDSVPSSDSKGEVISLPDVNAKAGTSGAIETKYIDKLIDQIKATNSLEAGKQLAHLATQSDEHRREILKRGGFELLWKFAKAGKLKWVDKWYHEVDAKNLKVKGVLGSGAFAVVYSGTLKDGSKKHKVAIKCMDENKVNLEDLRAELVTMSLLSPVIDNMVKFKGYTYIEANSNTGGVKIMQNVHCIILELMDTSLEALIKKSFQELETNPRLVKQIAMAIANGMAQLHSYNVLHRDLKPANILLKKLKDTYEVKIADFGFARQGMETAISVVGTPAYQAPEIFGKSNSQDVNKKADVYGYGVILWEMVTGEQAFNALDFEQLSRLVSQANHTKDATVLKLPTNCDPILLNLMKRCLAVNPEVRPEFMEICFELSKL